MRLALLVHTTAMILDGYDNKDKSMPILHILCTMEDLRHKKVCKMAGGKPLAFLILLSSGSNVISSEGVGEGEGVGGWMVTIGVGRRGGGSGSRSHTRSVGREERGREGGRDGGRREGEGEREVANRRRGGQ